MLTERQEKAAAHVYGPMLVSAGPGSGKTRVLTERIKRLLNYTRPERILVFTFTRKAAGEMQSRFAGLTDEATAGKVWFGTFHSIFYRWLAEAGALPPAFLLQRDTSAAEVSSEDDVPDYEELIIHVWNLLDALRPMARYDFILIDEFQDIDPRLYQLVRRMVAPLAHERQNVFAVGDEDQSIYGFRGAGIGLFSQFLDDFEPCEYVELSDNFRCSPLIVDASAKLIEYNTGRLPKALNSTKKLNPKHRKAQQIQINAHLTDADEYRHMASRIRRDKWLLGLSYAQMAILCRTKAQVIEVRGYLKEAGLPFEIKDTGFGVLMDRPPKNAIDMEYDLKLMERFAREGDQNMTVSERKRLLKILNLKKISGEEETETVRTMETYAKASRNVSKNDTKNSELPETPKLPAESLLWGTDYMSRVATYMHKDKIPLSTMAHQALSILCKGEKVDKIFLSTLHGSKGLEFDYVWIPGVTEGNIPYFRQLHTEDQKQMNIEEERRLFYVGITRAKTYLRLSGTFAGADGSLTRDMSRFLKEIGECGIIGRTVL